MSKWNRFMACAMTGILIMSFGMYPGKQFEALGFWKQGGGILLWAVVCWVLMEGMEDFVVSVIRRGRKDSDV